LPDNSRPREWAEAVGKAIGGRFVYPMDPWTFNRAVKVVQAAAKTGELPEPPPAPWFFQTFPR